MAVPADYSPLPNPAEPTGAVGAMHLLDCAQSHGGLDCSFSTQAEGQGYAGANGEGKRKDAPNRRRQNQFGHFLLVVTCL